MEHLTIAGKYSIVRKLGRGAFGTTYLAENLLGDTGKVVVKIAGPSDDVTAKRFQQEARVLGRLRHPHIVSLYDAGVLEDGRPFLVMGWVEGQSLKEILDERGTLSLQDAFKVVDTLLDALHYAHSHRHIHRDIKPSNVLVRKDGLSSGDVVLTDFGALGRLEFLTDQTITGELVGTPTYMAPEQLRGEPQSRATDIYGVGALLYRMIYGTPPYEGESAYTLFAKILRSELSIPEQPTVPDGVQLFLRRCLAGNPHDRFDSASEALAEVQKLLFLCKSSSPDHFGSEGRRDDSRAEPRKMSSRPKKAGCSWGSLLALALILVFVVWLSMSAGLLPHRLAAFTPIVGGGLLVLLGVTSRAMIRHVLDRFRTQVEKDAGTLLLGAESRTDLSATLALQVDQLVERCRKVEEKILGLTMIRMLGEYDGAKSSDDRQAALMNVVQLLEKLMDRLSPWYVRQQKLLTFVISSVTIVSGLVTIASGVLKFMKSL